MRRIIIWNGAVVAYFEVKSQYFTWKYLIQRTNVLYPDSQWSNRDTNSKPISCPTSTAWSCH